MGLTHSILDNAFNKAKSLTINKDSKIIFFSDLHKGDNSYADDFLHNTTIYQHAIRDYFEKDYTYIELGDGIELWENYSFEPIYKAHKSTFELLKLFYDDNRLYLLWGNHDMIFGDPLAVEKMLYKVFPPKNIKQKERLFNLEYHESMLLKIENTDKKIFLIHGHQADWFNYRFWKVSRFFVRYLWKPLQNWFNFKDPTSPAKNNTTLNRIELKLKDWMIQNNNQMVIAGHTHRPRFPDPGLLPYFNDGSCVHPNSIIGLEIENLEIAMVKWHFKQNNNGENSIVKTILAGPQPLELYL
ncbi:serine/threonine protein phosphatase [Aureibaculum marinum]|uniref:Serine/threonine protein phosphatase n=1 Tax=Aureibaculum marinum TaxID=2487930 RepID=A0A3N4NN61_9FLAO|nr:metallophosphoesterase [Aureibaculum marinum]RPD94586.1 serine/threonine protein phosphatase [Aureibaculum marinum]